MQQCVKGNQMYEIHRDMAERRGKTFKPCLKVYDDDDHSTLCPHEYLPPAKVFDFNRKDE